MKILIFVLSTGFFVSFSYAQNSELRCEVVPAALKALITSADRLLVTEAPENPKVLYQSSNRADIEALRDALDLMETKAFSHDMCSGTPMICLYKGANELACITNHHGVSIRTSTWGCNVPLRDAEAWLKWFDLRNITGPREEVESERLRAEQRQKDMTKWIAAIPAGLGPLWEKSFDSDGRPSSDSLHAVLVQAIPEKREQIKALLKWFGSGAGPWSGFPAYESTAEALLLKYSVPEIIVAIDLDQMSVEQMEGAARLFGGWQFSHQNPEGLKLVPVELKQAFWEHLKKTKDIDKLNRAKRAFEKSG